MSVAPCCMELEARFSKILQGEKVHTDVKVRTGKAQNLHNKGLEMGNTEFNELVHYIYLVDTITMFRGETASSTNENNHVFNPRS